MFPGHWFSGNHWLVVHVAARWKKDLQADLVIKVLLLKQPWLTGQYRVAIERSPYVYIHDCSLKWKRCCSEGEGVRNPGLSHLISLISWTCVCLTSSLFEHPCIFYSYCFTQCWLKILQTSFYNDIKGKIHNIDAPPLHRLMDVLSCIVLID